MERKAVTPTGGIRLEMLPGTGEGIAVDALIDDFLHGDIIGSLHELHEPHRDDHPGHDLGPQR